MIVIVIAKFPLILAGAKSLDFCRSFTFSAGSNFLLIQPVQSSLITAGAKFLDFRIKHMRNFNMEEKFP
jgi:hypothetical protein